MHQLSKTQNRLSWAAQIIIAAILIQTLYFKFTGAEESIYIFTQLGMEPWGRIGSGLGELAASILLLIPGMAALGALLAFGIISGALVSHFGVLGVEVAGDGGALFIMACVVFLCTLLVLYLRRASIPIIGRSL